AAYFSSADAYPRAINPRSNVHDMIYVNLNAIRPGQASFDSTITHEMQHMANFARCPAQEGWVDEGASELAMRIAGYDGTAPATGRASAATRFLGAVSQFAANYVDLPSIAGSATFSGDGSVSVLPVAVDANGVWFANRGDNLDSRITRKVDLGGVDTATLRL